MRLEDPSRVDRTTLPSGHERGEVYTVYQALSIADQRQESGLRYTLFVDSTAAIERIRSDSIGPGQRFAVAAIESPPGSGRDTTRSQCAGSRRTTAPRAMR